MHINHILRKQLGIILIIFTSNLSNAQYISTVSYPDSNKTYIADPDDLSFKYAQLINELDIKKHVFTLASDEFEGRETGEPGNEKAAQYLAQEFEKLDLPKLNKAENYFQDVAFTFSKWNETIMYVNGERYKHLWEYISFPNQNNDLDSIVTDQVIFVGYGIDHPNYSDYQNIKVRDKVVLMYKGEPINQQGISQVTNSKSFSFWNDNLKLKTIAAKNHGAKLVLFIEDDIKELAMQNRKFLLGQQVDLGDITAQNKNRANSANISSNILEKILGDKKNEVIGARERANNGKPKAVALECKFNLIQDKSSSILAGHNVLGFIKGSKIPEELIVVSAHYDHVGMRGKDIYNGADDNATGTTTVLEIAQALKQAQLDGNGPKRSVLCLLVTGEEKGLLGSEYYANNPIFPIKNTIANVNIDMIGRYDDKYAVDSSDYIYVIGSDRISTDLHEINEQINKDYSGLILDYTYNDENDPNRYYYRSDHYNFAQKGIPAVFFFSGVHEDYHKSTDTPEKIDLKKMERVGRHIFHLIWNLANRTERIYPDSNP